MRRLARDLIVREYAAETLYAAKEKWLLGL
jgi:hypothetical protein